MTTKTKEPRQDSITFKNYFLEFMGKLLETPLHGQEARARNRFIILTDPRRKEVEEERVSILKRLAEKDEKGEPRMKLIFQDGKETITNEFDLTPENFAKFQQEFTTYLNEDLILDVLPSNKIDFGVIKLILENTSKEFTIEQGQIYDLILKSFEDGLEEKK